MFHLFIEVILHFQKQSLTCRVSFIFRVELGLYSPGYAPVCRENGITRLGCWAHARRKFFDAFESSQGSSIGKEGLKYIKKIFAIEEALREVPVAQRFYERLTKSVPIVKQLKQWLDSEVNKVTPSSLAGKAIHYTINEWDYLMNCFCHGDYEIDNNGIERRIRPFTIG